VTHLPKPSWLDVDRMKAAQEAGLSAVCSSCIYYWRARDAGLPGHLCLASKPCGSPMAGHAFPEYEGIMPSLDRWCFVCGQPKEFAIRVKGSETRIVGICRQHLRYLAEYRPDTDQAEPSFEVSDGETWGNLDKHLPKALLLFTQIVREVTSRLNSGGKL